MAQGNNVIMIAGRVGTDPEVKQVKDTMVAKFNVAVNRTTKDQEGNYITDWFPCEFWGKQAEIAEQYIKKGTMVSVVGTGRIDKWEVNGEKKSRFLIHGDAFQLLSSKNDNMGGSSAPASVSKPKSQPVDDFMDVDDDIPPF